MALSNVKKKLAALTELRKDPTATIEKAWKAVKADAQEFVDGQNGIAHESDIDLIEQVVLAVIEDAKGDKKAADA